MHRLGDIVLDTTDEGTPYGKITVGVLPAGEGYATWAFWYSKTCDSSSTPIEPLGTNRVCPLHLPRELMAGFDDD